MHIICTVHNMHPRIEPCISIYLTDDDILNILVALPDHSAAKSTRPDEECGIPSFVPLSPPLLQYSLVPEEASGPTSAEFGTFEIPDRMDEESIQDGLPDPVIVDDQPQPVQYEIVESSTQRGKKNLSQKPAKTNIGVAEVVR